MTSILPVSYVFESALKDKPPPLRDPPLPAQTLHGTKRKKEHTSTRAQSRRLIPEVCHACKKPQLSPQVVPFPLAFINPIRRPETLSKLLRGINFRKQDEFAQLDELLSVGSKELFGKIFEDIKLPVQKSQYFKVNHKGKVFYVPTQCKLNGTRYDYNVDKELQFGGYGAVVFYKRSMVSECTSFLNTKLPDCIALKIGVVSKQNLGKFVASNYDVKKTKCHWVREFTVQRRLKKQLRQVPASKLPFTNVFGACLIETHGKIYAVTAMEAGMCDLFHLFSKYPLRASPTNQKKLLIVLQNVATSLERLHEIGLHHGDVKLANMLLMDSSDRRSVFMDFDGSVFDDESVPSDTYTEEYVSPQRAESPKTYSRVADDNWALGISFLIAVTLKESPIRGLPLSIIRDYDLKLYLNLCLYDAKMPANVKVCLMNIICGLLHPEEGKRMTAGKAAERLKLLNQRS